MGLWRAIEMKYICLHKPTRTDQQLLYIHDGPACSGVDKPYVTFSIFIKFCPPFFLGLLYVHFPRPFPAALQGKKCWNKLMLFVIGSL